ncbi:hypothetical protein GCM10009069_29250 [Algimonas arctica]|uniref:Tyr recombinase domain-containing protein n=1 Tax=Algimonas arctica TaxID=1479486 RepID=A0A8J3CTF8_9PROT|nr:hypothetical protein GCM10009069_29250 [Algimonas arctica]
MLGEARNLALLNLAIDSKLRGCDLVSLKVSDVFSAGSIRERAMVIQRKTSRPVQFEITKLTAASLISHVQTVGLSNDDHYSRVAIKEVIIFPHGNTIALSTVGSVR